MFLSEFLSVAGAPADVSTLGYFQIPIVQHFDVIESFLVQDPRAKWNFLSLWETDQAHQIPSWIVIKKILPRLVDSFISLANSSSFQDPLFNCLPLMLNWITLVSGKEFEDKYISFILFLLHGGRMPSSKSSHYRPTSSDRTPLNVSSVHGQLRSYQLFHLIVLQLTLHDLLFLEAVDSF